MGQGDYEQEHDADRIRKFMPPTEEMLVHEVYKGIILDPDLGGPGTVIVQLEDHDKETRIPKCCFICSGDDFYDLEPCHPIKYHIWITKDGRQGELAEIIKTELDKMVDEAVDQVEQMKPEDTD